MHYSAYYSNPFHLLFNFLRDVSMNMKKTRGRKNKNAIFLQFPSFLKIAFTFSIAFLKRGRSTRKGLKNDEEHSRKSEKEKNREKTKK
jgi:hypothetical protein